MSQQMIVKHHRKSLLGHDGVTLLPGANKVSVDWAKKAITHPIMKEYMEEGLLEFDFPEGKKQVDLSGYLATLKQPEAITTVRATIDAGLLQAWSKTEKRPHVKSALKKQLEALSAPTAFRDDSQTENESDPNAEDLKPDFSDDGSDEE